MFSPCIISNTAGNLPQLNISSWGRILQGPVLKKFHAVNIPFFTIKTTGKWGQNKSSSSKTIHFDVVFNGVVICWCDIVKDYWLLIRSVCYNQVDEQLLQDKST